GCRGESRELRDALRLRTSARFSDRRLDRARFEREIFPREKKSPPTTVTRVLRIVFRGIRRLCAAVSVSSCPHSFTLNQEQQEIPPAFATPTAWQATRLEMTKEGRRTGRRQRRSSARSVQR